MKKLILFTLLLIFLYSCQTDPLATKESFIDHHEDFITQIVEEEEEYSANEWKEKDAELEKIIKEGYNKYKDDLKPSEQREFWTLASKYYFKRVKDNVDVSVDGLSEGVKEFFDEDLSDSMGDIKKEIERVFDEDLKQELKEIFDDEFKDDLREAAEELKDVAKEIGEELKKTGEELKEIFKDIK